MKIFVIHYKKLIERKKNILQQFAKYNITNFEFIDIDRDELTNYNTNMFANKYSNSLIAITLSHFQAYKEIAKKYKHALILEDDVILSDNFSVKLANYMAQLPIDFSMLFLGDGCNLHIETNKIIPNQYVYKKCLYPTKWGGAGATRCTDSYIISKTCAETLCNYINNLSYKINEPIDWWLNTACRHNNFNVYWAEPTIVTQGTQSGIYETSH